MEYVIIRAKLPAILETASTTLTFSLVISVLFRRRYGVTRSAVITTRTAFVVSVMVMALVSERGLASTFRKPLIRSAVPMFLVAAQKA